MNENKRNELSHFLEELMFTGGDCTPCEAGLPCPFFGNSTQGHYCKEGNCVEGMTQFVIGLVKSMEEENV